VDNVCTAEMLAAMPLKLYTQNSEMLPILWVRQGARCSITRERQRGRWRPSAMEG
jgi:hypothetical protein